MLPAAHAYHVIGDAGLDRLIVVHAVTEIFKTSISRHKTGVGPRADPDQSTGNCAQRHARMFLGQKAVRISELVS